MRRHHLLLLLIGLFIFPNPSCNIGKDLNKDLADARPSIDTLTRDAGRNIVAGASDSATLLVHRIISGMKGITDTLDPDIRKVYHILDSLGATGSSQITRLGDSLNAQITRLKGQVDPKAIQKYLISTVEKLTGTLKQQTKDLLADAIQSALNSLKADSTHRKIDTLVANLLDDANKARLSTFLSGALAPTIDTITAKIHGTVQEEIPFVKRQAVTLLIALGVIACAIIGWVWYQKRRYSRLLEILTYHINGMPAQDSYDNLTKSIQQQTQSENLEPLLRETLKRQGINNIP
jgi:hypothetical protein